MNKLKKPMLFEQGKTLFLTLAYPPNPSAAAVVHRHLLDQFDPDSFVVLTGYFIYANKSEVPAYIKKHFIYLNFEFFSSKLHKIAAKIQKYTIPLFLKYYIFKYKPKRLIISFPDIYWLDICVGVAIQKGIPFIPYLHDTITEGTYNSNKSELAAKVQNRIFEKAYKIALMSEGMRNLYKNKYHLETTSWEHIYPEEPIQFQTEKILRGHWSGDVYAINQKSVKRISDCLKKLNIPLTISNGKSREQLEEFGITGDHIQKVFYHKRSDYLKHLSISKILFIALNYPDECKVHEDELSTIFSTKTPEYLGSNSLIIYHGPGHYFLARFITDNKCGIVIDTRDEDQLKLKIINILENYESYSDHIKNAQNALQFFKGSAVAKKVISCIK